MDNKQFDKYSSIPASKFALVNTNVKISDVKLGTKPASFAKDSFRRFCKNKSSVVAAFILGILILMAIFVPIFIEVDPDAISPQEQFLAPKLFEAGTGFWDGTRKYSNVVYDPDNECPADYYKPAVLSIQVDDFVSYTNNASAYGRGGYVRFENQSRATATDAAINYLKSDLLSVTSSGNYTVSVQFGTEQGVLSGVLGEYKVTFSTFETANVTGEDGITRKEEREITQIVLQDWGTSYADVTFDLSKALADAGHDSLNGKLVFWLKAEEDANSYILLKNCVITADENVSNHDDLAEIGFSDATLMVLKNSDNLGQFPLGYWNCNGIKGVYQSEVVYCSFVYDTYLAVYDVKEVTYAWSEFEKLIQQGKCSYDPAIGPESFVSLSEDCPVDSVISQENNLVTGKPKNLIVNSYRYRDFGYTKMPKFIFGTDNHGRDVFSYMFDGLRTSLILGVCTFIVCFLFGLVWGAISGYFGGIVDLTMERFCDILGGVPSMVVMTLCILHLGNTFFTFVLALCMTGWMGTAGRTRTQFYRFKHMEYVLASRTLGSGHMRLIFKHILSNSLGTIVTSSVLMIPSVIFSEASLAYLNLGLQGMSSFGVMLSNNQSYISTYPYLIVVPSVVMALLMISFNLFGNGLRDALNPALRGAED